MALSENAAASATANCVSFMSLLSWTLQNRTLSSTFFGASTHTGCKCRSTVCGRGPANFLLGEESLGCELGALDERAQLGPRDLRMAAPAEAAVGARDDALAAHALREAPDALRDELGMLHYVGRMGDHARDKDLSLGQLHVVPHRVLVLMARIRRLDEIRLRFHAQHQVHDFFELEVEGVRPVPAAPAQVVAHALLGDVAQRMVKRFYSEKTVSSECVKAHLDADAIPERREPRIVDLQRHARGGNRLVLDAHRLGNGVYEFLVRAVVLVAPVDLEAPGRRRGQEGLLGPGEFEQRLDFALQ